LFLEAGVDLLQGISQAGGSRDKQLIRISRCDQSGGEKEPKTNCAHATTLRCDL